MIPEFIEPHMNFWIAHTHTHTHTLPIIIDIDSCNKRSVINDSRAAGGD